MTLKIKNLNCECYKLTHLFRVMYDDENPDLLFNSFILSEELDFLTRFYVAVCYLFKLKKIPFLDKFYPMELPYSDLECEVIWDRKTVNEYVSFLNSFLERGHIFEIVTFLKKIKNQCSIEDIYLEERKVINEHKIDIYFIVDRRDFKLIEEITEKYLNFLINKKYYFETHFLNEDELKSLGILDGLRKI